MFYPDKNCFLVGFVESSASREFRTNTSMVTTMTRQLFLSLAAAAAAIHIDLPAVFNPFKYENRFEKLGTLGSWSGSNTGQLFQCLNNDFCPKHKKGAKRFYRSFFCNAKSKLPLKSPTLEKTVLKRIDFCVDQMKIQFRFFRINNFQIKLIFSHNL